jgi:hypothetical protein
MEVFQQAPLSVNIDTTNATEILKLREGVRETFESMHFNVSDGFRQAVKACIDHDMADPWDTPDGTEDAFARKFCEEVVGPLEADFKSLSKGDDPDAVLSGLKLPIAGRRKPPLVAPKPAQFKVIFLLSHVVVF